jgi:hypothetical protein
MALDEITDVNFNDTSGEDLFAMGGDTGNVADDGSVNLNFSDTVGTDLLAINGDTGNVPDDGSVNLNFSDTGGTDLLAMNGDTGNVADDGSVNLNFSDTGGTDLLAMNGDTGNVADDGSVNLNFSDTVGTDLLAMDGDTGNVADDGSVNLNFSDTVGTDLLAMNGDTGNVADDGSVNLNFSDTVGTDLLAMNGDTGNLPDDGSVNLNFNDTGGTDLLAMGGGTGNGTEENSVNTNYGGLGAIGTDGLEVADGRLPGVAGAEDRAPLGLDGYTRPDEINIDVSSPSNASGIAADFGSDIKINNKFTGDLGATFNPNEPGVFTVGGGLGLGATPEIAAKPDVTITLGRDSSGNLTQTIADSDTSFSAAEGAKGGEKFSISQSAMLGSDVKLTGSLSDTIVKGNNSVVGTVKLDENLGGGVTLSQQYDTTGKTIFGANYDSGTGIKAGVTDTNGQVAGTASVKSGDFTLSGGITNKGDTESLAYSTNNAFGTGIGLNGSLTNNANDTITGKAGVSVPLGNDVKLTAGVETNKALTLGAEVKVFGATVKADTSGTVGVSIPIFGDNSQAKPSFSIETPAQKNTLSINEIKAQPNSADIFKAWTKADTRGFANALGEDPNKQQNISAFYRPAELNTFTTTPLDTNFATAGDVGTLSVAPLPDFLATTPIFSPSFDLSNATFAGFSSFGMNGF